MQDAGELADVVSAVVVVLGKLVRELERAGAIDKGRLIDAIRREAFLGQETDPEPGSAALAYLRYFADALANEPSG